MSEQLEPRLELATVRGIACVALVAYHVVGPTPADGMRLPEGSYWHSAMNSLDFLRMPMFSVLAGYLYARQRVDAATLRQFLYKKALRLLAPLVFVTTVMFVLRRAAYGDPTSYPAALFFHYQHLWFLQSLLLIFLGIAVWDSLARPSWVGLCVTAVAAIMVSRTFRVTDFLSINGAFYLLPFFALGMILQMEPAILRSRDLTVLASAIVVIVMVTRHAAMAFGGNSVERLSMPAALCGISAGYLMLVRCPRSKLFEAIGSYSFTIYLWHSIAASAARKAMAPYVGLQHAAEFALLLTVGIVVPIIIQVLVAPVPVLSVVAAGIRTKRREAARADSSRFMPAQPSFRARFAVRSQRQVHSGDVELLATDVGRS